MEDRTTDPAAQPALVAVEQHEDLVEIATTSPAAPDAVLLWSVRSSRGRDHVRLVASGTLTAVWRQHVGCRFGRRCPLRALRRLLSQRAAIERARTREEQRQATAARRAARREARLRESTCGAGS